MGKRRLNDTRALVDRPFQAGEDHSISVRRIENGYLVRQSACNPETGEYRSSESFSSTPPRITPPKVAGRQANGDTGGTLRSTKAYMGDA